MRTLLPDPRSSAAGTLSVAAVSCLLLAGCSTPAAGPPGPSGAVVTVSGSSCVWSGPAPRPGSQQFTVRNTARTVFSGVLADSDTGATWAETGVLAPGTSRTVRTVLPAGSYRWRCIPYDGEGLVSTVRRTSGTGDGARPGRPVLPLDAAEATNAVTDYRAVVSDRLGLLATDTDALSAAVHDRDRDRERATWLTAHLDYERLGAAYGTFGDLDGAIDGLPAGLPAGTDDPGFTGFLRVERDLWGDADDARLTADTQSLGDAVHQLVDGFPTTTTNPGDLPLRAHEILEMAASRELTGRSDQGSHTGLATVRANVDGTAMVLDALTVPLAERDPQVRTSAHTALDGLAGALDALRRPDGSWPAPSDLSGAQREDVDARLGDLLEQLAEVPGLLEMPPDTNPD